MLRTRGEEDGLCVTGSIEDEVAVLASLQKPKKLTIVGSDGHSYAFLCKPKDDLRKDLRMMEFTTMLNRLLAGHRDGDRGVHAHVSTL